MPELPDLEVIGEFLAQRILHIRIESAQVRRPIVVRNLLGGDPAEHLAGRQFVDVVRRGKFLLLPLDDGTNVVIHPMLAGRIRYGNPLSRHRKRDVFVIRLQDGHELRYHDAKDMGKVYLTDDLGKISTFATLGPEATAPDLTFEVFSQRMRRHRGEVKRVLTSQTFVAGIGNAYADEICWRAGIYPFRRRAALDDDEVRRLYEAMRTVLTEAVATIRAQIGEAIDMELRDFLAVHGKAGEPCPQCGSSISEVKRERRATHFCRTCQPGLLVGGSLPRQARP